MAIPEAHRSDIDGLRAIAVLLVVLFHANLCFTGGFVGVDVFFVLSGFLITGTILREQAAGTFSLSQFWIRRIRRIVPAATCMVGVTTIVGIAVLQPQDLKHLADSVLAQQLTYSNIYFLRTGGYFDGPAELKPLLHTWSLSVEEQFYFLFPLLLMGGKHLRRGRLLSIVILLACISLALSEFAARQYPAAGVFLLPTRAWELMLGSVLAFLPTALSGRRWLCHAMAAIGLGLLLGSALLYSSKSCFPGLAAVIPTFGTALFIMANCDGMTYPAKILTVPPLCFIGKISYSVYLWHWPLLVLPRLICASELSGEARCTAVIASFVFGYLSWLVVEEPIRRKRILTSNSRIVTAAFASVMCALMVSKWIQTCDGMPSRLPNDIVALSDAPMAEPRALHTSEKLSSGMSFIGDEETGKSTRFLLWGDSHAQAVSQVCERLAIDRGIRGIYAAQGGVPPLIGVYADRNPHSRKQQQIEWNDEVVEFAIRHQIKNVILVARWEKKIHGTDNSAGQQEGFVCDSDTTTPSAADALRVFRSGVERTIKKLETPGTSVWFLMQAPVQKGDPVRKVANAALLQRVIGVDFAGGACQLPRGVTKAVYEEQQHDLLTSLNSLSAGNLSIVGPGGHWFDSNQYSRVTNGQRTFYYDDNHLSTHGAEEYFRSLLEPIFDKIASSDDQIADRREDTVR